MNEQYSIHATPKNVYIPSERRGHISDKHTVEAEKYITRIDN